MGLISWWKDAGLRAQFENPLYTSDTDARTRYLRPRQHTWRWYQEEADRLHALADHAVDAGDEGRAAELYLQAGEVRAQAGAYDARLAKPGDEGGMARGEGWQDRTYYRGSHTEDPDYVKEALRDDPRFHLGGVPYGWQRQHALFQRYRHEDTITMERIRRMPWWHRRWLGALLVFVGPDGVRRRVLGAPDGKPSSRRPARATSGGRGRKQRAVSGFVQGAADFWRGLRALVDWLASFFTGHDDRFPR